MRSRQWVQVSEFGAMPGMRVRRSASVKLLGSDAWSGSIVSLISIVAWALPHAVVISAPAVGQPKSPACRALTSSDSWSPAIGRRSRRTARGVGQSYGERRVRRRARVPVV
jgi:hypothetical protein